MVPGATEGGAMNGPGVIKCTGKPDCDHCHLLASMGFTMRPGRKWVIETPPYDLENVKVKPGDVWADQWGAPIRFHRILDLVEPVSLDELDPPCTKPGHAPDCECGTL